MEARLRLRVALLQCFALARYIPRLAILSLLGAPPSHGPCTFFDSRALRTVRGGPAALRHQQAALGRVLRVRRPGAGGGGGQRPVPVAGVGDCGVQDQAEGHTVPGQVCVRAGCCLKGAFCVASYFACWCALLVFMPWSMPTSLRKSAVEVIQLGKYSVPREMITSEALNPPVWRRRSRIVCHQRQVRARRASGDRAHPLPCPDRAVEGGRHGGGRAAGVGLYGQGSGLSGRRRSHAYAEPRLAFGCVTCLMSFVLHLCGLKTRVPHSVFFRCSTFLPIFCTASGVRESLNVSNTLILLHNRSTCRTWRRRRGC